MATAQDKINDAFQIIGDTLLKSDALGSKEKRITDLLESTQNTLSSIVAAKKAVVKDAVENKTLPKAQLAEIAGVTPSTINKWAE